MTAQVAQTPLPPEPSLLNPSNLEAILVALTLVTVSVVVFFLVRPVFRAWARRVEAGGRAALAPDEVDQLREQVSEVPMLRERLHELEERVEFAERMLAQRRDQELLPRGDQS